MAAIGGIGSMQADGIADPLAAPVTLAAVLADLFTLAGVRPPAAITERIG